jgi:phosphopantothenoylcysteine decarboxylase/phosphopantothenate--cysteine ligase
MRVIVTAGPTREPIDSVRFITNASSGRMGYACAAAAFEAGHQVTLITGPTCLPPPQDCQVVPIVTVEQLRSALEERFDQCDALVMTAAVGDFSVKERREGKIPRAGGPIQITLVPTIDVLATVAARRRKVNPGVRPQVIVGFAVETTADVEKARREMQAKSCDYMVLNTPAAMGVADSEACILAREGLTCDGIALPWARRGKDELARKIVELLGR